MLKSPPHLGRVKTLLEMFPQAQFVHIVRDPAEVFASTKRLWQALFKTQGLQVFHGDWLEEFVYDNFDRMYVLRSKHTLDTSARFGRAAIYRNDDVDLNQGMTPWEMGKIGKTRDYKRRLIPILAGLVWYVAESVSLLRPGGEINARQQQTKSGQLQRRKSLVENKPCE